MRFGLTPWSFNDLRAQSLAGQARIAEDLGYDSFWLPESHFTEGALPDPLMLLAAVATQTERIRLGTTSYLLPMRNPLQAAEQVAVLDQLSGGRVLLGVGRGWSSPMLRAFNVAPKDKRSLFEAHLSTMIRAWSGEAINAHTEPPLVLNPLPVQRPHPPVWVAAFGPKALAQAGSLGLPYLASPMETLSDLRANFDLCDAAAREAGRAVDKLRPIMRTIYISRSRSETQAIRNHLTTLGRPRRDPNVAVEDWALIGDKRYVADRLAEYESTLGATLCVATRLRIRQADESRLLESMRDLIELTT